ncbi:MAG: ornithine carbamoyltransferase [Marmoricola sp.]
MTRHFLRDDDLSPQEQAEVLALAARMKQEPFGFKPLDGPVSVATIYDKPTLRTQVSFSAGIAELGGHPMMIDAGLAAAYKRESIADVARVLGRQVGVLVWRTYAQANLDEMAAHAGIPIINALTDEFHPCQLLADLLTVIETKGKTQGVSAAFVGDGACNQGNSWVLAGATAGMHVRISSPVGHFPDAAVIAKGQQIAQNTGGSVKILTDPVEAVSGADVVITDTWISMGKEEETDRRLAIFANYAVDEALLAHAAPDAVVMHCLPAYRGKEISAAVIDGAQSVVWQEAENRRHAQKAVMAWLWERR